MYVRLLVLGMALNRITISVLSRTVEWFKELKFYLQSQNQELISTMFTLCRHTIVYTKLYTAQNFRKTSWMIMILVTFVVLHKTRQRMCHQ